MSMRRVLKSAAVFFGFKPLRDGVWPEPAHLAAVALLVHVARADGRFSGAERHRLEAATHAHFCESAREATHLVRRAEALDDETGDVTALLEMIGRDEEARRRVLVLAFSVASADGHLQEIEENLVWRVGRLLGFDDDAIKAIRETQTAQP
ncbi:MAG: tellurite resistance TerB family protein [Salinarimonas sp.]